jgi:L-threonylcarbamoyladenylate synthase
MAVETVSIDRDGAATARAALDRCVSTGGVALFPADGLYGLACDPLNADAIRRIHEIKGRDDGKPSAVMYFDPLMMREVLGDLDPATSAAVAALLPGPVTLVVANPTHRYPLACRSNPERLGLRLIEGPLAGASCPVFQTSANASGEPPPPAFTDVDPELAAGVDLAIDGGRLTGLPSTVIDVTALDVDGAWAILREGGLAAQAVAEALAHISSPR